MARGSGRCHQPQTGCPSSVPAKVFFWRYKSPGCSMPQRDDPAGMAFRFLAPFLLSVDGRCQALPVRGREASPVTAVFLPCVSLAPDSNGSREPETATCANVGCGGRPPGARTDSESAFPGARSGRIRLLFGLAARLVCVVSRSAEAEAVRGGALEPLGLAPRSGSLRSSPPPVSDAPRRARARRPERGESSRGSFREGF